MSSLTGCSDSTTSTNRTAGTEPYFFREIDRGTMPVFRLSLHYKRTSFFVKLLAYCQTWQQDLHTKHYGIKNFRVLTVINSRDRVKNMLAANKEATSGRGIAAVSLYG